MSATTTLAGRIIHAWLFAIPFVLSGCTSGDSSGSSTVRPAGGLTWVKSIGVESNQYALADGAVLPDDGLVMAGTLGSEVDTRLVVTRLDDAGNVRWSRTYGSEGYPDPLALTAMVDAAPAGDGGFFIAGHSRSGMVVSKYDASGQRRRTALYGGATSPGGDPLVEIAAITRAHTGGYVIGGRKLRDVDGRFRDHAWLQYGYLDGTPGPVSNDVDGPISDEAGTVTTTSNYERIHDLVVRRSATPTGMLIGVTGTRHEGRLSASDVPQPGVWVAEYALDTETPGGDVLPGQTFRPLFTTKMPSEGVGRDGAGFAIARFPDTDTYLVGGDRESGIADGGRFPFRMHVGGGLDADGRWKPLSGDVLEDVRESGFQGRYLDVVTDAYALGTAVALFRNNEAYGRIPRYQMEVLRRRDDLENTRSALVDLGDARDLRMQDDERVTLSDHQGLGALEPRRIAQVAGGHFALGGSAMASGGRRPWIVLLDHDTRRVRFSRIIEEPGCGTNDDVRSLVTHDDGSLMVVLASCLVRVDPNDGRTLSIVSETGPPVTTGLARAIQPLPDGGFVAAALREDGTWLLGLDESGSIRWQEQLPGVFAYDLEPASAMGTDFLLLASGVDAGTLLISFDRDGIARWQRRYSGIAASVLGRAAGGEAGHFLVGVASLARVDAQGDLLWAREGHDFIQAIEPTRDGGIVLAGDGLTRLGPDGGVIWSATYGPDRSSDGRHSYFGDVVETAEGGFVAVGSLQSPGQDRCYSTTPEPSLGGRSQLEWLRSKGDPRQLGCSDVWVVAVDRDGETRNARRFGTASHDGHGVLRAGATTDNGVLIATVSNGFDYPLDTAFVLRLSADLTTSGSCPRGLDEGVLPLAAQAPDDSRPMASLPTATSGPIIPDPTTFESTPITDEMITARACSGVSTAPRITATAEGGGLVRSTPAGITCGQEPGGLRTACEQAFALDTDLVLEAVPMPDARFEGWDGACAAAGTGTTAALRLTGNLRCTARFSSPQSNQPPVARFSASPAAPVAGTAVTFDARASTDDVGIVQYRWDFDDDGLFDASGDAGSHEVTQFVYATPGTYTARLSVVDASGLSAEVRHPVTAVPGGSGDPTLTLSLLGTGDGSVTYTPAVMACSKSSEPVCVRRFPTGTRVIMRATPYSGFRLGGWDGCDSVSPDGTSCTVTLTTSRSVSLVFR
ncbi:PKD domain-containing protein [Myxococcota bacterium]|nr:PKD domain-containing protein [Myxococcota bacterium]